MAANNENSFRRGLINRNMKLNKELKIVKPTSNLFLKCLIASGIIYGSIYTGFWGTPDESENIVQNIISGDLKKAKTELVTAYNDTIKFIGGQATKLPENSFKLFNETKIMVMDAYKKFTSDDDD